MTTPTAPELGKNCVLRIEDSPGAGTFTEVPGQVTTAIDLSKGEADTTSKSSGGWQTILPTQRAGTVTTQINEGSPQLDQIIANILSEDESINCQVIQDSALNAYVGPFYVLGLPIEGPVSEATTWNVTLRPAAALTYQVVT